MIPAANGRGLPHFVIRVRVFQRPDPLSKYLCERGSSNAFQNSIKNVKNRSCRPEGGPHFMGQTINILTLQQPTEWKERGTQDQRASLPSGSRRFMEFP